MEEKENKQKIIEEVQQIANPDKENGEKFDSIEMSGAIEEKMDAEAVKYVEDDGDFDALMAEGINMSSGAADAVSDTEQKDTTADGANAEGDIQVDVDKLAEKEEAAKKKKKKLTDNKLHKHIVRNNKRILKELAAVAVILLVLFVAGSKFVALYPYAFTVNDKVICYVNGDKQAKQVRDTLLEDYKVEGTEVRAVDTGGMFKMEKCDEIKVAEKKVMNVDEAVAAITTAAAEVGEEGKDFNVTLACTKTEVTEYVPEPNYVQDDSMVAGEKEVTVEGVSGQQKVSTTYTTVNGVVQEEAVTATEILDEGSPATIVKGTLGLPDGEDWRTYEGDPVFNDGEAVITTAKKYVGKLKYRLGAHDLNSAVCCLGLVKEVYAKYGVYLPMSHKGMKAAGVGVSYSDAQPGDIICYQSHVGLYAGNGMMVDATSGAGVSVRPVSTSKLVTVRRIPRN